MSYTAYLSHCNRWIDSCSRIEFTWRDVFSGSAQQRLAAFNRSCWHPDKPYEPAIYLIHDSTAQVVYVGRSRRIVGRLADHVGHGDYCTGGKCITPVGHYIRNASPHSHGWRISVLDLPSHLEEPTIWRFNPFYNTEGKPDQLSVTPIPAPTTPF